MARRWTNLPLLPVNLGDELLKRAAASTLIRLATSRPAGRSNRRSSRKKEEEEKRPAAISAAQSAAGSAAFVCRPGTSSRSLMGFHPARPQDNSPLSELCIKMVTTLGNTLDASCAPTSLPAQHMLLFNGRE